MPAFLQVNLLGGFQLFYDGKPVELAHSTRLQTLIAYIVLHRSAPVTRERLASVFWPDTSEGQSLTNLRNLLHQLRLALPFISTYLTIDNNVLEWQGGAAFQVDIESFRRCLAVPPGQSPTKQGLEEAVRLYKGDLFPACYDDWILPFREELHQAFIGALDRLASLQEEAREYPQALHTARRLVQAEPLQPTANQRLMRLYTLVGDRPAALKAYRTYSRLLWEEVGAKPDAQIEELYQRLRAVTKLPQRETIEKPEASPMVGRAEEWRKLLALWQNAVAGKIQVGLITGEAGIGYSHNPFGITQTRRNRRVFCEELRWAA